MSITIEKKHIVTDCPDCASETHFCKLHQKRDEARYYIVRDANYDRDPRSVSEKEIDSWLEEVRQ